MKNAKSRLAVALVAAVATCSAFAAFTGNIFYWHGTDFAAFGDSANWTLGETTSPYTDTGLNPDNLIPGSADMVYADAKLKFDLDGKSYTVAQVVQVPNAYDTFGGPNSGKPTDLQVTNGTFTVTDYIQKIVYPTVCDNGTFNIGALKDNAIHWSVYGLASYNVKDGGVMTTKNVRYQGLKLTVAKGGVYTVNTASVLEHPTAGSDSSHGEFIANGRIELPYGVTFGDAWAVAATDSYPENPYGGHFRLNDGGEMLIGGSVTRTGIANPLRFYLSSGELIISNTVAVTDNARLYFFVCADKTTTLNVLKDSSFHCPQFSGETGSKLVKKGLGTLKLGRVTLPDVAVNEGVVETVLNSVSPATISFAEGTTLRCSTTGVRFDTVTAYDGFKVELDESVRFSGAVVLKSSDADFLAAAATAANAGLAGTSFSVYVSGEGLIVAKTTAHVFDATQSSDLSDPAAWGGTLPSATDDVQIKGNGTAIYNAETTKFKSIAVSDYATLAIEGGTLAEPVDLPVIELDYHARLLVKDDAFAQMTNTFTTVGDIETLPVLEVATNATLIAQTPGPTAVIAFNGDNDKDYGFRLKNVKLNWYGNIRMWFADTGSNTAKESRLTLGYAADGETTYIAVDCQGGTWTASGEGNFAKRNRTPLIVALPDAVGGTVIPVGRLLFRDYKRIDRPSADGLGEYCCPGMLIGYNRAGYGKNNNYNPTSVSFDVDIDGASDFNLRGEYRIGGGAHVHLKGQAKWVYTQKAWNDYSMPRMLSFYQNGTLDVSENARLEVVPTDHGSKGVGSYGTLTSSAALTVSDATLSAFNWYGESKQTIHLDAATLQIGLLRRDPTVTLNNRTMVFAGFKAAELGEGGLTITAADVWRETKYGGNNKEWTREVTMGVPLTGEGGLTITNDLPAKLAAYGMNVTVSLANNTATGVATAEDTLTGSAKLLFADGANWAGTVKANDNVGLTNLVEDAAAATANFNALEGTMPIRVWKTGGVITANDQVNLSTVQPSTSNLNLSFKLLAMDEKLAVGDVIELGLYPEGAVLPANSRYIEYSSAASSTAGFVMLKATYVKPGLTFLIR